MSDKNTLEDFEKALSALQGFIGETQLSIVKELSTGEEGQFFIDKMVELAGIVQSIPDLYAQDGKGDDAVVYLHYFGGSCDFYITEKSTETDDGNRAFGLADLGYGPELGYISLDEIISTDRIELDFHFTPKTLGEIKKADPGLSLGL